jgi:dTDP-4-dehydrorhamnose reductase
MKTKVVVVGGTGMLGAMATEVFAREPDMQVVASRRRNDSNILVQIPVAWQHLDAQASTIDDCRAVIADAKWVINCIGITKPLITDDDPVKVERATRVNSLFPHTLAAAAEAEGARVLQIATDCVFSGAQGDYSETSVHDALDVYGKTKSLGEVASPAAHHLRASIIGPEPKDHKFLLDWFLGQPRSATLSGFNNHSWNGVTTLHFARVLLGVVRTALPLPRLHHLVPTGRVTKAAMLEAFARAYGRSDIRINKVEASSLVDRTLTTSDEALNRALWAAAGYADPPTVDHMIDELARFTTGFGRSAAA